jgi:hypothetical protein
MAGLNEGPPPSPYEKAMQDLQKDMDRTGADSVSRNGLTLSKRIPGVPDSALAFQRPVTDK